MVSKSITYWIIGILVVDGLIYLVIPKEGTREYDSFASCLTNAGFTMYGTDWCPHCKAQKEMFGASFDKIDYVNCDINAEECAIQGVQGYPTWKINGQSYSGTQSLEILAERSGCQLIKDNE